MTLTYSDYLSKPEIMVHVYLLLLYMIIKSWEILRKISSIQIWEH